MLIKITTSRKEMNTLNNILIKNKKKKQNKSLKIKHTENSSSEDEYQYYRKKH